MSIVQHPNRQVKPRLMERVDFEAIETRVQLIAKRDAALTPSDPRLCIDELAGIGIDRACQQILEVEHPPIAGYQFNRLYAAYMEAFFGTRRQMVRIP